MKKILSILLAAVLLFSLCACAKPNAEQAEEPADVPPAEVVGNGIENPMVERSSLEEINELTGCNLCKPGVMGVTDEVFYTIDIGDHLMGQYTFDLNGLAYTLRGAAVAGKDISGIYVGEGTAFPDEYSGEPEYYFDETRKLSRWMDLTGQYVLQVEDNGSMDQETFRSISEEMMMLTSPVPTAEETAAYYESLAGDYADSYSQRATAHVEANGSENIRITVSWSNSATETEQWTMTASRAEDGLLYYTDCEHVILQYAEDGTETKTVVYADGSGYFGEYEGTLSWNGAEDESCQNCEFTKM